MPPQPTTQKRLIFIDLNDRRLEQRSIGVMNIFIGVPLTFLYKLKSKKPHIY
jgi:hypothetical protein